jgi:alkylated DNA repair dioxygenase AlkB
MKHLFNEQIKVSYDEILKTLQESGVKIHDKLKSRSTMNFGKVYQYKGVEYEETDYDDIPSTLYFIGDKARTFLNLHFGIDMDINNCLVNIYSNGKQKMGYHSDDIEQLVDGTGVLIVSVGCARILSFRKRGDVQLEDEFVLTNGSIFYMDDECQKEYEHAILKSLDDSMRISLTFRELK